jgi:membrane protein
MSSRALNWARDGARRCLQLGGTLAAFTRYTTRRFIADGCLTGAGALSYTTLISLVPLTAIVIAIYSGFPIFSAARDRFLALLLDTFAPTVGEEAAWWFQYFASIAAQTTAVGVVALIFTAILLLGTIEDQLHAIWRVRVTRPWLQRVLIYWTVLTLGPLLLGMSLSLSGYLEAAARTIGFDAALIERTLALGFERVARLMPFLLETFACTLVYALIPNCTVRWREAVLGGLVAAILIELLKLGFGIYIARLSSYRTVYGAVAAIPIFLLWMYISWAAVLFGAVLAAALPQWRVDIGEPGVPSGGRHLGVALAILAELGDRARRGGAASVIELARALGLAASTVDDHLAPLQAAGFVTATTSGGWVLARALASTPLFDLYLAMRLPLAGGWSGGAAETPWQRRVAMAMQRVAAAESGAMQISLAALLAEADSDAAGAITLARRR